MLSSAAAIGPGTVALVETIMRTKPHPEQGFRACLGILQSAKTYGDVRLEAACQRGLPIGACTYGSISSILKTGLDRAFHDVLSGQAPDARAARRGGRDHADQSPGRQRGHGGHRPAGEAEP